MLDESETLETREHFKVAMRRLAATVTIISCSFEGKRFGMNATAVSSLSMEPPSIIVCVNHGSSIIGSIRRAQYFSVNILRESQAELSRQFSSTPKHEERFKIGDWCAGEHGIPYLLSAQAAVFSKVVEEFTFATHSIFVGAVSRVIVRDTVEPLLYADGQFAGLKRVEGISEAPRSITN